MRRAVLVPAARPGISGVGFSFSLLGLMNAVVFFVLSALTPRSLPWLIIAREEPITF